MNKINGLKADALKQKFCSFFSKNRGEGLKSCVLMGKVLSASTIALQVCKTSIM
jgi:hypothetical protein